MRFTTALLLLGALAGLVAGFPTSDGGKEIAVPKHVNHARDTDPAGILCSDDGYTGDCLIMPRNNVCYNLDGETPSLKQRVSSLVVDKHTRCMFYQRNNCRSTSWLRTIQEASIPNLNVPFGFNDAIWSFECSFIGKSATIEATDAPQPGKDNTTTLPPEILNYLNGTLAAGVAGYASTDANFGGSILVLQNDRQCHNLQDLVPDVEKQISSILVATGVSCNFVTSLNCGTQVATQDYRVDGPAIQFTIDELMNDKFISYQCNPL